VGDLITGTAACYSSGTPGRAIVQVRENHIVTDDPSQPASVYQGPGEAPGSLELFLSGIVSCAVLMLSGSHARKADHSGRCEPR